jgi:hypothetical protein
VVRNVASVSTTICMPQTSKRVLPQSDKPPQGMHNHRFPPNPMGPGDFIKNAEKCHMRFQS